MSERTMKGFLNISILILLLLPAGVRSADQVDWRSLERQGVQDFYRRDFEESAKKLQQSLDQAEAEGIKFPDFSLLRAVRFLSESYERIGKTDQALRTYTYLLAFYEEMLGPRHPDVTRVKKTIQKICQTP